MIEQEPEATLSLTITEILAGLGKAGLLVIGIVFALVATFILSLIA